MDMVAKEVRKKEIGNQQMTEQTVYIFFTFFVQVMGSRVRYNMSLTRASNDKSLKWLPCAIQFLGSPYPRVTVYR